MPAPTSFLLQIQAGSSRDLVDKLARTPLSQIVIAVTVITVIRLAVFLVANPLRRKPSVIIRSLTQLLNEVCDAFAFAAVLVFMLIRPFGLQAFLIPTGSMWPEVKVNDYVLANKMIYRFTDPKVNDVVVFHPPKDAAISPDDLDLTGDMKFDFVKRCIGVPGDLVEIKNGVLYRNGKRVEENYIAASVCVDDPNHCTEYRQLSGNEQKQIMPASFKLVNWHSQVIPLNYTNLDANAPIPMIGGLGFTEGPYHVAPRFQIAKRADQQRAMNLPAVRVPEGFYLMMGDNRNNSYDGRAWGLVPRASIVGRAELIWWPLRDIHRPQ